MRFSFAFLLAGAAARFLAFGAPQIAAIAALAFILGGASFLQRNGNGLPPALDLAAFAAATALELAVLELVHHPAGDSLLT